MATTIPRGAARLGALALLAAGLAGCASNPTAPSDVLYLQVYEIEIGTGRTAAAGDRVVIDYVTWAYDSGQAENKGREVDSRTGYTFFLGANQVIPAFDQGLVGMRVGGVRRLVIPPAYALGGRAFGSAPPNTPLVADVRMVEAQPVTP